MLPGRKSVFRAGCRPDSSPPDPGKPTFYFGGVDDFSPGLAGRVGDQFWHPEGVQVKAPNYRFSFPPHQWTGEYPRGLAGPEIVELGGLNGPFLPQNPLEKVGGFAPHLFQWVLP